MEYCFQQLAHACWLSTIYISRKGYLEKGNRLYNETLTDVKSYLSEIQSNTVYS